jgi:hypothetical protein
MFEKNLKLENVMIFITWKGAKCEKNVSLQQFVPPFGSNVCNNSIDIKDIFTNVGPILSFQAQHCKATTTLAM